MNDTRSDGQPIGKINTRFKLKRREKWAVFSVAIIGLLALLLWRPINRAALTAFVLRAEKPAATVVNDLVAEARDPAALLERLWKTDKIPHRVLVMTYLKVHANTDSALLGRLESLLLAAAQDGDLEVRELALDTLAARRHPDLRRLAQEQLRDADPAARVLGLSHLRKAGDAGLVPVVVPFLDDPNPLVVVHAALTLRHWTGEDFGVRVSQAPAPFEFNHDESAKVDPAQTEALKQGVQRWKDWWKLHQKDYPAGTIPPSKTVSSWRIPAPDFSLADLGGKPIQLSALKGKVVLITLWDTVTTNCFLEIPALNELHKKHSNRLAVLAISLDSVANERGCEHEHDHASHPPKPNLDSIHAQVQQVVQTRGITYPVLIDPTGSVGRRFIGDDLPNYILIDAEGQIRRRFIGGRKLATLEAIINEVIPTGATGDVK